MTFLEKAESLPPFVKIGGALLACGLLLFGAGSLFGGSGPDIPEGAVIAGDLDLVDSGGGTEPAGAQDAQSREERKKMLSEGVEMYGWVDSWPLNGEEVYAVGFDSERFPYSSMRNIRRLVGYAEQLMLENGCGTLKLLVYSKGRRYGDGADLLITSTVGRESRVLSSGAYSPLETAAGHPVKPNEVAEALADRSNRKLQELLGKNLLVAMPVSEFYQTESGEWAVISSMAPQGMKPFPIPLRIQADDPKLGIVVPEKSILFSVVLVVDAEAGVVEAYGKPVAPAGEEIPDGIPASELR